MSFRMDICSMPSHFTSWKFLPLRDTPPPLPTFLSVKQGGVKYSKATCAVDDIKFVGAYV